MAFAFLIAHALEASSAPEALATKNGEFSPPSLVATENETPLPAEPPPATKPPLLNKADRYEFSTADRIKISFYERPDMSGEYRIREDGTISIPFVGRVSISGMDAFELEQMLADAFFKSSGRSTFVNVEVVERRPVYVTGFIGKAGVYAFAPGMTVLHAVAMSGGLYRPEQGALAQIEATRETTRMQQSIDILKRAVARHTKLVAERNDQPLDGPPKRLIELVGRAEADLLMVAEDRQWQLRMGMFERQVEAHTRNATLAKNEVAALRQRLKIDEERVELGKSELGDLKKLENKGLARRQRLLEVQRLIADQEGSVRDTTAAIARAERTLADSERDIALLRYEQSSKLEAEIRTLEEQIAVAEQGVQSSKAVIGELTGVRVDGRSRPQEIKVSYHIMRRSGDSQEIIDAIETTKLRPGDVLRVTPRLDN